MPKQLFKFKNQRLEVLYNDAGDGDGDTAMIDVSLYDTIGKDPWDGSGMSASDFKKVLDGLPRDKGLHLRVNSKGGDVHEGMAIMNTITEWPQKVIATIDGIAASTSSWMILAADEVRARKGTQMFIHDAMAYIGWANADEASKAAGDLEVMSDQIAGFYADKSGKGKRTMRDLMKAQTLLTGEAAKELGLVDTILEERSTRNFTQKELDGMKNRLAVIWNSVAGVGVGQQKQTNIMNKEQMLALLKKHGVQVANEATDEQLQAALNKLLETKNAAPPAAPAPAPVIDHSNDLAELKKTIAALTESNNAAKLLRITNAVETLIKEDKLEGALKDKSIARCMKDDTFLEELQARTAKPPGAAPFTNGGVIELVSEGFADVQNFILNTGTRFNSQVLKSGNDTKNDPRIRQEMADRSIRVTNAYRKHRKALTEMYNTNTIDSDLQRIVLLQEMLEEFVIPLLPLTNFAAVFQNVPLEGTDKVGVPFYPLQATTATSWNPSNGYNTMADSTTNIREVVVGGSGTSSGSSAAANTAKDRKYLGLAFDSYTLRRQPFFNAQKLAQQNANRLAVDVFKDIISRVVTVGNYGASAKAVAANAFTGDDIADLYAVATGKNWPMTSRALVLDHTYMASLLKDPTFKQYLAYGSTDPIRKAKIQEAYGFEDIPVVPNLTSYSPANEFLVGFIHHMYAMLVATAPIMPSPEVRNLLTRYDIVTDPKTGLSFEYRQFADVVLDQAKYVVECSYGAEVGVASALQRLTSQ